MKCSSCGADIVWKITEGGKKMPIDSTPAPDGNLVFIGLGAHPVPEKWTGERYKSHFATCPDAKNFRRSR